MVGICGPFSERDCGTGESGVKGTFGVLSLLPGRLSLFFGVGHFTTFVPKWSRLVVVYLLVDLPETVVCRWDG